jgi:uncharacterized repeat protein (TIGR03803 family)
MMREKSFAAVLATAALWLLCSGSAWGVSEKILLPFNGTDGYQPVGLSMDASGNLWGVTSFGGTSTCDSGFGGCGAVFELVPVSGGWKAKIIYSFRGGPDGETPVGNLLFGSDGNIYGVTSQGGTSGCQCGTVYQLAPQAGGWKQSVIYRFNYRAGYKDGITPASGLIQDAAGNMYGTTEFGGDSTGCNITCGAVYELSPAAGGGWTETILYSFQGPFQTIPDGYFPYGPLAFDALGNLYGTTYAGGANVCDGTTGCGVLFKLSPGAGGTWTESLPYQFHGGTDGARPSSPLVFDSSGNLYGTTIEGGGTGCTGEGCGTVFEFSSSGVETVLHRFSGPDGQYISGGLTFDSAGDLVGTAFGGGTYGFGVAFKLQPNAGGTWSEALLHIFGNGTDGEFPNTSLVIDASGNIYGGTEYGGKNTTGDCDRNPAGCGIIFQLKP